MIFFAAHLSGLGSQMMLRTAEAMSRKETRLIPISPSGSSNRLCCSIDGLDRRSFAKKMDGPRTVVFQGRFQFLFQGRFHKGVHCRACLHQLPYALVGDEVTTTRKIYEMSDAAGSLHGVDEI